MPIGVYRKTKKHKQKIGKANKGKISYKKGRTYEEIYGKEKAKQIIKKISKTKIKYYKTHDAPMKGKKHSEETKEKFRKIKLGKKTGRKPMLGKSHSKKTKQLLSEKFKGRTFSKEAKKKMRISAIKRIERNHGIAHPNYNSKACEFFKTYDKKHNTNGQYATNGGEYYIKELGYYPDYINFDKKIIIEYDENYHKGQIKKDKGRQMEIQKLYPDFEFVRVKESKGV